MAGVTITSTFKTPLRCQQAAHCTCHILLQLRRGFAVLTQEIFRPLYLALVRPILEYGLQESLPRLRRGIVLKERMQRLATRMVEDMRVLAHEDRLRRLNIFSHKRRRLRGDLI